MGIFGIFDDVLSAIRSWQPHSHIHEEGYTEELAAYLDHFFQRASKGLFPTHFPPVRVNWNHYDITVGNDIIIEMKFNLRQQTEADRLVGQVKRYITRIKEGAIIVHCGEPDR